MNLEYIKRNIEEIKLLADGEDDHEIKHNILSDSGFYEQQWLLKKLEETELELAKYV